MRVEIYIPDGLSVIADFEDCATMGEIVRRIARDRGVLTPEAYVPEDKILMISSDLGEMEDGGEHVDLDGDAERETPDMAVVPFKRRN